MDLEDRLHRFFKTHEDNLIKCRVSIGKVEDEAYKGLFEKFFYMNADFTKKEIKEATRLGLIEIKGICWEGRQARNVVLWKKQRMLTTGWKGHLQLFVRRIKDFFKRNF